MDIWPAGHVPDARPRGHSPRAATHSPFSDVRTSSTATVDRVSGLPEVGPRDPRRRRGGGTARRVVRRHLDRPRPLVHHGAGAVERPRGSGTKPAPPVKGDVPGRRTRCGPAVGLRHRAHHCSVQSLLRVVGRSDHDHPRPATLRVWRRTMPGWRMIPPIPRWRRANPWTRSRRRSPRRRTEAPTAPGAARAGAARVAEAPPRPAGAASSVARAAEGRGQPATYTCTR